MIQQYLQTLSEFVRSSKIKEQSIASFILEHGRSYERGAWPPGWRKMRDRRCYMNAGRIALADHHYRYVEGYAETKLGIPVPHAWLTDASGKAFDPTWKNRGTSYFGIEFTAEELAEGICEIQKWGLLLWPEHVGVKLIEARKGKHDNVVDG